MAFCCDVAETHQVPLLFKFHCSLHIFLHSGPHLLLRRKPSVFVRPYTIIRNQFVISQPCSQRAFLLHRVHGHAFAPPATDDLSIIAFII